MRKTNAKDNYKNWKKFTPKQRERLIKAAENTFKKVGRPSMQKEHKAVSVTMRIDPEVLRKIKTKASRLGKPYQTLINEVLKKAA